MLNLAAGQRSLDLDYAQARTAAVGLAGALGVFLLTERLSTPTHDLTMPLDGLIPFVPASWWVYVMFYPYVITAAALASPARFEAFKLSALLAFAIALGCFWVLPELVPRPDIASIDNAFLRQRFDRMWRIDQATHGFPSLHVSLTLLAAWAVVTRRGGRAFAGIGVVICLSTLTVKQHTCADVAGGAALALLAVVAARRLAWKHLP